MHSAEQNWMSDIESFSYCTCSFNASKFFSINIHKINKSKSIKSQRWNFLKYFGLPISTSNIKRLSVWRLVWTCLLQAICTRTPFLSFSWTSNFWKYFFDIYGPNEKKDKHKHRLKRKNVSSCLEYYKITLHAVF